LKGPVQSVEVSLFVHATEDLPRVAGAVASALSVAVPPQEERLEGHFGNQIVLVKWHLAGDEAMAAVAALASRLTPAAKRRLGGGLAGLVDEHSALYLRFDKQCLVEGRLEEGGRDSVRIKVKPRGFMMKAGASEFYSRVLLGGGG